VPQRTWRDVLQLGGEAEGWVELPHLQRGVAPWADARAGYALRQLLRRWAPDVVHTHTSKAGWIGRRAVRSAGVSVVVHTFHGHVLQDYFGRAASAWLRRLERRLAARTDVLLAVSDSCADELAAAGVAARARFVVVPPAVPLVTPSPRAAARDRLGIPGGQFRLACVGRLVPIKRVAHFVEMLAQRPDWHGDVIGDGPERARLQTHIAAVAAGRVQLRGAEPDIASLLSAYDALVLPSVREGCPLVAVEAFRAGVPVVGYDVPGVRDVLTRWGHGLLVPVAAGPAGLAAAVARLAADAELVAATVAAAADGVGRFAPAAVARELLAVYRAAKGAVAGYAVPPEV
jgi:glycosyltransferase involved in cell wall biosynthesis